MKDYVLLVIMFFLSSVLNNYSLKFNISVPLLMIFRSGSLMANMVLGVIILNKSYDIWKYISVILITIGIFISTIASGRDVKESLKDSGGNESDKNDSFLWWLFGVSLLTISLFISARMGLYQEVMYKKRGKHVTEALFYTHILPLPIFFLMGNDIWRHFVISIESNVLIIPIIEISIQTQFIYLTINFLSHYLCVRCVYTLSSECSSLVVTLIVTLRKFASLIFSIIYFHHPFTTFHWLGTALLIIGTVMFTEIITKIRESVFSTKATDSLVDGNDIQQTKAKDNEVTFYSKVFSHSNKKIKSFTEAKPHINYKLLQNSE